MMKVYELAKAVDPYVVSMRRYFHENPELSNQEEATLARVKQELDGMGIPYEGSPTAVCWASSKAPSPARARLFCCVQTAMRCL